MCCCKVLEGLDASFSVAFAAAADLEALVDVIADVTVEPETAAIEGSSFALNL